MSAQAFAVQLRDLIKNLKDGGTAAIYCDNLIAYLDEVSKAPAPEPTQAELAKYQADLQLSIEQNRVNHASQLEMFKSVITAGQNAIRSSFLLNGGAAVAILAFIGHLTEVQPAKVAAFSDVLVPFVLGVLAITVTSGFTYLSQWLYASPSLRTQKCGFGLNLLTILLGVTSYGFFIWGMCVAYSAFRTFV